MSFFERLFGYPHKTLPKLDVRFGRYTDSYKSPAQYDAWDRSIEAFAKENYLESYLEFFKYLRDEQEDNVRFWEENDGIRFEILQGSKKVVGFADQKKLMAEAKIAKATTLEQAFMQRLLEQNFELKYGRFALDGENDITILFDTYTLDGSPYKLYYALKEIATKADKQDDLLIEEFPMLTPIENTHLQALPESEKEPKYHFITQQIKDVFKEIDEGKLNKEEYPGGIAYLLLHLCYKLDYLTKPEGFTMETLERIHRRYFAKDGYQMHEKNRLLRNEFQKLLDRPKEKYFSEMYDVKTTFGITSPINHEKIVSMIDGELYNMDWYKDNGHTKIALAIPGYIAGFSLFQYAIPKPDKDLFHLYFQITEANYFQKLGFPSQYLNPQTGVLHPKNIKKAIKQIADSNKTEFPNLHPAVNQLAFENLADFARSYLLMIRALDC